MSQLILIKAQFELTYEKKNLNVLALIEKGVFRNGWTERLNTLISLAWPYPTSRLRVW